jgi:hypothetical protein
MKKLLLIALLLIGISATAQKIDYQRIGKLEYNLFVTGVKDTLVKYEWTIEAPPTYYSQLIFTKRDTTYYHFQEPGFVSVYVRYKNKAGKWSDDLYLYFNVE